MSVRPITESERNQAYGGPFAGWGFLFGATQGLLLHLRIHALSLHTPLMPTHSARLSLPVLVLGGGLATMALVGHMYGDSQLQRLHNSHVQDRALNIESRQFKPLF